MSLMPDDDERVGLVHCNSHDLPAHTTLSDGVAYRQTVAGVLSVMANGQTNNAKLR